jgi:subtilisin-like proprotein convertase family protein
VALSDLDVYLDVTHTWVGDLKITLTHLDSGTVLTLVDRPGYPASDFGCDRNNIDATLDDNAGLPIEDECDVGDPTIAGRFRPQQPLSAFDGEIYGGQWRLNISDNAGGDVGTLDEWCLEPNLTP